MKTDPNTGELILPSGTILSSQLTRSKFLASVEGTQAEVLVRNEPWCSFRFKDKEDSLVIVVFFKGENLESVHFTSSDPKFGINWKDCSEEKELARKQANDQWLKINGLIQGNKYVWGSVWSTYDKRSGFSTIVFQYQKGT